MFSKACEYGIRAVIYITKQSMMNLKVSLKDISKAIDSPEAYTSKILQQLARHTIIVSTKGPTGGFFIEKNAIEDMKLCSIVSALDGDHIFTVCGLGLKLCNEKTPCPVHHQFKIIREDLRLMLENTTVKSLAVELSGGGAFLKV